MTKTAAKKPPLKMGMMPSAPGEFIREEVFIPLGLSITKAAEIMRMRRPTLSDIVNGKARLTPEVALRLEKAFGVSMELLLRMQTSYDVALVRKQPTAIGVRRYVPA